MLFTREHAEIYDLVYPARGKDYAGEAQRLTELVRERRPDARSLLDVACGTGSHLAHLRRSFDHVEGVELAPAMRAIAAAKLPGVSIHEADMTGFRLDRKFDVVTCLYSSIAYLAQDRLAAAVAAMASHLVAGGLLIVEPWYGPQQAVDHDVQADIVRTGTGLTIARVLHTSRRGERHHVRCHFLVAGTAGVRHFSDTQVLGIYPRQTYLDAVTAAGCAAEYLEFGLSGRGLLVGTRGPAGSLPTG